MFNKFLKALCQREYLLTLLIIILFNLTASAQKDSKRSFPKKLQVGTSDILIPDYSSASLGLVKEAGIKNLELTWYKLMKVTPAERLEYANIASKNAKKAGVKIWSTHLPYGRKYDISEINEIKRADIVERIKEYIDLALVLKVKQMVIHPSFEPIDESVREAHIESCRKSLKELAAYIKGKPIKLNIEDLPRTCLGNTSQEILRIIEGIPEIGICFDANHLLQEKPEDFIRKVGDKIRMVHISDFDGIDEKHWMPGKGVNDWNEIISALVEIRYSGPFMYEVVKRKDDTFTLRDIRLNFDTLIKSWINNNHFEISHE